MSKKKPKAKRKEKRKYVCTRVRIYQFDPAGRLLSIPLTPTEYRELCEQAGEKPRGL